MLLARGTAEQHVYKACMRVEVEKTVKNPDLQAVVAATAAALKQTQAAIRLVSSEIERMRAAAKRARAAVTDLSAGDAPIGNDIAAFEGRLLEVRAEVNQVTAAGDDLAKQRRDTLAKAAEEMNKLYQTAAKRIDAGAMGEERAVLDEVKAAYHPVGDADREVAACGNRISADVPRAHGKLDLLQDRLARIRASLAPAAEAGLSNAAARIESDVTYSEKSLQSLQELAGKAQQCAAQARQRFGRNAAAQSCAARNATLAKYNAKTGQVECACREKLVMSRGKTGCVTQQVRQQEEAAACSKQFPHTVFVGFKNNEPQCGCPQGWTWNKNGNACMTVGDRQREAGLACARQFPGSVASRVNLKNEDCGCPSGTVWNGPGKKRCIPAPAQQRLVCPAGTFLVLGNRCLSKRDLAAAECRKRGSSLVSYNAGTGRFKCTSPLVPPLPSVCITTSCMPQRAQGPARDLRGQLPPRAPGVRRGPYTAGTGR